MKKIGLLGVMLVLTLTGCTSKPEVRMKIDQIFTKVEENIDSGKIFYYTFSQTRKKGSDEIKQKGDFVIDKKDNMAKFQQIYQNEQIKQELSNYAMDKEMYRYIREGGEEQLIKIKQTNRDQIISVMKEDMYQTIRDAKECLVASDEISSKNGVFLLNEESCDIGVFQTIKGKLTIEVNAETFDFTVRAENSDADQLVVSYDKDSEYIVTLPMDKAKAIAENASDNTI